MCLGKVCLATHVDNGVGFYPEEVLRQASLAENAGSQAWEHTGLPENLHALLSPYGQAFVHKGTRTVCHGGASLEEVVVPFVRLPVPNCPTMSRRYKAFPRI